MPGSKPRLSKHLSRIAAVQVMYQKDVTNDTTESIITNQPDITEFQDSPDCQEMHINFFKRLISKFDEKIAFDDIIDRNLDSKSKMMRSPVIIKSIIKVGIIEIICEKTAIPIIINEYVEITKKFAGGKSVKFINAILDKISKQVVRQ
jgi:N utilization substance protein B